MDSIIEPALAAMEEALVNADAEITLTMGGYQEISTARVWQGAVLVEWERDDTAGGVLLRPALAARLVALGTPVERTRSMAGTKTVSLHASPRIVAALSPHHAQLARQLGEAATLHVTLNFDAAGSYVGGEERYAVQPRGGKRTARAGTEAPLLRLTVGVRRRATSAPMTPSPTS